MVGLSCLYFLRREKIIFRMSYKSRQNVLNSLYNQDIAPQDSEITSFFYHKTLALESLIAIFSLFIIAIGLTSHTHRSSLSYETRVKFYNIMIVFSCAGMVALILKKLAVLKWTKQKKESYKISKQIIYLLLECLFFVPCPTSFSDSTFEITTYSFQTKEMSVNSIITFYLLINKFTYIANFLIHSELFYGSRPDRLSRLYTVQFGTFNAIKFLINEKPGLVVIATFSFNFFVLPFAMLLIQGDFNESLSSFGSCLHYVAVTQVTVGYGDLNVASIFGRVVAIMTIMVGVTNTSLLLILFMRLMELSNQQEESHFLLESLQKKVNLTKARVVRIQKQWIHSNTRCTKEQFDKKQEQIKAFRYNNRRDILLERIGTVNIKRMMISNFSQINQSLRNIQQKNNIIKKCIDVIRNAETSFIQKVNKKVEEQSKDEIVEKDQGRSFKFQEEINSPYNQMALVVNRREKKELYYREESQKQKKIVFQDALEEKDFEEKKEKNSRNEIAIIGEDDGINLEKDVLNFQKSNVRGVRLRIKNMGFNIQILVVDLIVQEIEESLDESINKSPYLHTQTKFEINYSVNYEEGPISIQCLNKIYHPNITYEGTVQMPQGGVEEFKDVKSVIEYLIRLMKEPGILSPAIEKQIDQQLKKDYKLFMKIVEHTNEGRDYQNRQYDKIVLLKKE